VFLGGGGSGREKEVFRWCFSLLCYWNTVESRRNDERRVAEINDICRRDEERGRVMEGVGNGVVPLAVEER
jgi:hypothetical protein